MCTAIMANYRGISIALSEWQRGIVEGTPSGDRRIYEYAVQSCGWSWLRAWYARRVAGQPWCGWYAGHCEREAGLRLEYCRRDMPSTRRLDRACREGRAVRIPLAAILPGAILVVGPKKSCGDHITRVLEVRVLGHAWATVEGNARGRLPDGADSGRLDGVIQRVRYGHEARYGVRWPKGAYAAPIKADKP
mgnify:CR=1 FL=1